MPNFLKTYATPSCTSLSTTARNAPKNATVAITTQVVATTSSRLGHVTCFISTRTSCRNSRVLATVPATFFVSSEPVPPCDSSPVIFTARVALNPHSNALSSRSQTLAGEEGLEPPYPVLETGVLAVGRLPFTLSTVKTVRRVYPATLHEL